MGQIDAAETCGVCQNNGGVPMLATCCSEEDPTPPSQHCKSSHGRSPTTHAVYQGRLTRKGVGPRPAHFSAPWSIGVPERAAEHGDPARHLLRQPRLSSVLSSPARLITPSRPSSVLLPSWYPRAPRASNGSQSGQTLLLSSGASGPKRRSVVRRLGFGAGHRHGGCFVGSTWFLWITHADILKEAG